MVLENLVVIGRENYLVLHMVGAARHGFVILFPYFIHPFDLSLNYELYHLEPIPKKSAILYYQLVLMVLLTSCLHHITSQYDQLSEQPTNYVPLDSLIGSLKRVKARPVISVISVSTVLLDSTQLISCCSCPSIPFLCTPFVCFSYHWTMGSPLILEPLPLIGKTTFSTGEGLPNPAPACLHDTRFLLNDSIATGVSFRFIC